MSKTYVITGPDGKKYRVTAPDGATQEEVMGRVRSKASVPVADTPADSVDFDAKEMISNVPGSAVKYATDIYQAVRHPVETGKAVGGLVRSVLQKADRKSAELMGNEYTGQSDEAMADAAGRALKERYGSVNALKSTMMNDPVGALADVSGVGTATRIPRLANAAAALEPVNLAAKSARSVAKVALPKSLPSRVYESGVKLNHRDMDRQAEIVQTAMDRSVVPKQKAGLLDRSLGNKGLKEIRGEAATSQAKADQMVADATANGQQILADEMFQYLPDLRLKNSGLVPKGPKKQKKIDAVENQMRQEIGQRWTVTPAEMQKFKVEANKETFNEMGLPKKDIESKAWDSLRKGSKKSLEDAIPDLKETNLNTKDLLDVQRPLKQSIKTISKSRLTPYLNLGTGVAAGTAHLVGGPAATAGVLIASILANPASKARIGIALNKVKKGDVGWMENNLTRAEARVALYLAEQQKELQQEDNQEKR